MEFKCEKAGNNFLLTIYGGNTDIILYLNREEFNKINYVISTLFVNVSRNEMNK